MSAFPRQRVRGNFAVGVLVQACRHGDDKSSDSFGRLTLPSGGVARTGCYGVGGGVHQQMRATFFHGEAQDQRKKNATNAIPKRDRTWSLSTRAHGAISKTCKHCRVEQQPVASMAPRGVAPTGQRRGREGAEKAGEHIYPHPNRLSSL